VRGWTCERAGGWLSADKASVGSGRYVGGLTMPSTKAHGAIRMWSQAEPTMPASRPMRSPDRAERGSMAGSGAAWRGGGSAGGRSWLPSQAGGTGKALTGGEEGGEARMQAHTRGMRSGGLLR